MAKHALLAPSAAHRWLKCTPSARLAERYPDTESEFAKEGTTAHKLSEILLQAALGLITREKFKSDFNAIKKSEYYNKSMLSYCKDYRDYCLEAINRLTAMKKGKVGFDIERTVSLAHYAPESFGSIDFRCYNDVMLIQCDLKFGKGVLVSPVDNEQFGLYALGSLGELIDNRPIETVEMHVYQPRINNIECWTQTRKELAVWWHKNVKEQAQLAFKGEGEYNAGSHCGFCPAKMNCLTWARENMDLVNENFPLPNSIPPDMITKIVLGSALFESWIKSVKKYAAEQAGKGVKFPGLKLVAGRSNRVIKDPQTAAIALMLAGVDKEAVLKPTELRTLTDLEKTLGADTVADLIGDFIEKPDGAPTLVAEDDNRPEIGKGKALKGFSDLFE